MARNSEVSPSRFEGALPLIRSINSAFFVDALSFFAGKIVTAYLQAVKRSAGVATCLRAWFCRLLVPG